MPERIQGRTELNRLKEVCFSNRVLPNEHRQITYRIQSEIAVISEINE